MVGTAATARFAGEVDGNEATSCQSDNLTAGSSPAACATAIPSYHHLGCRLDLGLSAKDAQPPAQRRPPPRHLTEHVHRHAHRQQYGAKSLPTYVGDHNLCNGHAPTVGAKRADAGKLARMWTTAACSSGYGKRM